MGRTFVVAVGIGQYSSASAPALPTAALDAIRVAAQLQQTLAAGADTYLFLHPAIRDNDEQKRFDDLRATLAAGTHVAISGKHDVIDQFWRQDLRELAAANPGSRLFLYWCGHGFTETRTGLPSLLCADYTEALATRVVDRVDLLETLHSDAYANLRSQIVVIDACANAMQSGGIAARAVSNWNRTIDQVSVSSAARGQYAHGDDTGAYFTRLLLQRLSQTAAWPDLDDFSRALRRDVESSGQKSTPVLYRRGVGDDEIWRRSNQARDEFVALLERLPIGFQRLRPLYLAVVSALSREPGRGAGTTIPHMVDDLWNANGAAAAAAAPYPVVEFALRLHHVLAATNTHGSGDAATLEAWLNNAQFVHASDRDQARSRLTEESEALYLVVELIESRSAKRTGEIERFKTRLLRYDHATAVEPWSTDEREVSSWPELEARLQPLLNEARTIANRDDARLTVEFVTNVFDIEPHRMPIGNGGLELLGELNPVTLRLRAQRSKDARQPWVERANAIRGGLVVQHIHGIHIGNAALQDCCVLFIRHPLPQGSRPAHPRPLSEEWNLVRRAIMAGVPFICWPLQPPAAPDFSDYETALTQWVSESRPVDRIPSRVYLERVAGPVAANVNVFWDDPLPVWQLREIRMG